MTAANPSPLVPSPAKPCARASVGSRARHSAPPAKARRDIMKLALIGKDLDERHGLQSHQLENRNGSRQQRSRHRYAEKLNQLQWENLKRQAPAEGLAVDDRDQAPCDQQAE